jgi:acetolactate synthase regulatory subunit
VKGGNNLADGAVNEETLKHALKFVRKRGFSNEIEV